MTHAQRFTPGTTVPTELYNAALELVETLEAAQRAALTRAEQAERERDRLREALVGLLRVNDAHEARGSLGTARAIQTLSDSARSVLAATEGSDGKEKP